VDLSDESFEELEEREEAKRRSGRESFVLRGFEL
jgi:hypothetical protein